MKEKIPLTTALGELWNSLFTDARENTPLTLEAQQEISTGGDFSRLGNYEATAHKLKAEEIDAIRQTQSKGFWVVDIDPNALPKNSFGCVYDDQTIGRMLGSPMNGYGFPVRVDSTAAAQTAGSNTPYWRTVTVEKPGNWVKIEFLPARASRTLEPENIVNPVSVPFSGDIQNTDVLTNTDQYTDSIAVQAGQRTVLVDFETPSATPHIARHGTIFKTYFSNLLISFSQLNVRIRITIGFNSEIHDHNHKEETLHLFGGQGLTTDSPIHPVPFCINDYDVVGSGYAGTSNNGVQWPNGISSPVYLPLIFTPRKYRPVTLAPGNIPNGIGIVYITNIRVSMTALDVPNPIFADIDLVQMKLDNALQPLYLIKRFASIHGHFPPKDPAANLNWQVFTGEQSFQTPIRVSLRPNEALVLRIIGPNLGGAPNGYVKFSVNGWSFGDLSGKPATFGFNCIPYETEYQFKEHPFPQDLDTGGFPRR